MIKLFFLMMLFFMGSCPLKADELDNIKSPFEDVIPKPVVIIPEPAHQAARAPIVSRPKPKPVPPTVILLPTLDLQGVMVGEDIHQAIINDTIVPVGGSIKGVRVDAVTKEGVELFFKGKKFFLKVD